MKITFPTIITVVVLALAFTVTMSAAERQALPGHLPGVVSRLGLQPVGRLPGGDVLDLLIGLPLRNRADFDEKMTRLYDPRSPDFHRWLTPCQIAEQFGPSAQDYQAVIKQAKSNGLSVTDTHADHTLLQVRGTVANIEKMFQTTLRTYQHPTEARTFFAPDTEPSVDLSVSLLHVTGLDNFSIPHAGGSRAASPRGASPADLAMGSGPSNSFWGNDFHEAYVPHTSLRGEGQVLGLLELDGYYPNDIKLYIANSGISTSVVLTNVPYNGGVASPGANNGEVALDIEMAIAMAPGLSKIVVYEAAGGSPANWLGILKKMQEDNSASQLSASWSFIDDANDDAVYEKFAMQGQSFFLSSGDLGAYYDGIGQWADDPYVTIVGGTRLSTVNAGGVWAAEEVWTDGFGRASGGGISTNYFGNYPIPSWQQTTDMSRNGGSTTMRNSPDVAMVAYELYTVRSNGFIGVAEGTSAATPLWAAFTALVNEQAAATGQPAVGFLNPVLYAIGNGSNYTNCFHDIVMGQNNVPPANPPLALYRATNGYDLCTGWGSPNGSNLINALMPYTGATWVDFNYMGAVTNGSFQYPFRKLADGVAAVPPSGNLWIKTAGHSPETMKLMKPMTLHAVNGPANVGD